MEYIVKIKRRVRKMADRMPKEEQSRFDSLTKALRARGPARPEWPNYSKLGRNEHHCHLSYHWVACWRHEAETIEIEVYYVGSRENAPY
jgi:hypothetical protein